MTARPRFACAWLARPAHLAWLASAGIALAPLAAYAQRDTSTTPSLAPVDSTAPSLPPIDSAAPSVAVAEQSLAPRRPAPVAAVVARVDTVTPRPRAVEYDEAYGRRLTIHRWGSYVMLPLFVAQYLLGNELIQQKEDVFSGARTEPVDADLRQWHTATAIGVGTLFVVNTTTGVWNLVESRHDPNGRGRRTAHAVAMLIADAGFVATGLIGRDAVDSGVDDAKRHRNVALVSMGIATASAAFMWFTRD